MARTLTKHLLLGSSICLLGVTSSYGAQSESTAQQPTITVLYDAFGKVPGLHKDWGYSALVEAAGKQILFDTGNNPDILAANAKSLHVDLSRLDFVVMSHRHGDHMGGMEYVTRGDHVASRTIVMQQKTQRPVQFEIRSRPASP
jgi:7,8-dihydropterin-6-yl-methyl-4-(beta-D-ribofuranosyl)aminobenzene 5'-phosphate synthase